MSEVASAERIPPRAASSGAARSTVATAKLVVVNAAASALFAAYLWQIFYTMPHLAYLHGDSGSYLHLFPHRTVGTYYFSRAIFVLWNDYYGVAAAQGILRGAASLFLFYAINRASGSSVLALAALLLSLFKMTLVADTQAVASDSLFATACLALLGAAVLLWQRPTATRIGLFVVFGFAASIIRPLGPAIVWSLVLVLALRLWWGWRRPLAILVAGCIGSQIANAAIQYVHYGMFAPAHLGFVLIGGSGFIADENAPANTRYEREFALSTTAQRAEYKAAATWRQKFEVMDREYDPITWRIALKLFEGENYHRENWSDWIIHANQVYQDISFAAIRHNPVGYGQMTLVKLVAGTLMFFGDGNWELQRRFTPLVANERVDFARDIPDKYWTYVDDGDQARLAAYIREWQTSPLEFKHDLARPLRDLVGLLASETVSKLFIWETAILVLAGIGIALWRRRFADFLTFPLLFAMPPWFYLLAVSLTHIPIPRYMDAASIFVNIALASGVWIMAKAVAERASFLRRSTGTGAGR